MLKRVEEDGVTGVMGRVARQSPSRFTAKVAESPPVQSRAVLYCPCFKLLLLLFLLGFFKQVGSYKLVGGKCSELPYGTGISYLCI